jgi:uroporphyrin-III C-methyltransferase/precorrin-2 dehydrogenase/sirohydrochlorin ferrochelatase
LKLHGRRVVVVGAGPVAASKLGALKAAGAHVVVVAPDVCEAVAAAGVRIERRAFQPADLDGAWFVVAAAPPAVNRHVAEEAERQRVFVNAVDDPSNASVYLGGVVRRGGVTLGISTAGAAPALAGLLREALDALLPADLETWSERALQLRRSWRERQVAMEARRPELLQALNALYDSRDTSSGTSDERVLAGAGGGAPAKSWSSEQGSPHSGTSDERVLAGASGGVPAQSWSREQGGPHSGTSDERVLAGAGGGAPAQG